LLTRNKKAIIAVALVVVVVVSTLSIWFFSPLGRKTTEQTPLEENKGDLYLQVGSKHIPLSATEVFSEHGISLELTAEEKENVTSLEDFFIMGINIPENIEMFVRTPNEYRLMITGEVEKNVSLGYGKLLERFELKQIVMRLYCMPSLTGVGKFVGPSLYDVISYAKPRVNATKVIVVAGDGYESEFMVEEIREHRGDYLLAMAMNGYPLAIEHGYPARLALTGEQGTSWVKWVMRIIVESDSSSNTATSDFSSTTRPEAPKVQGIRTVFFQRERSLGDPCNSRRQIVSAYVYRVLGYDIGPRLVTS
jgi:DMSO/TMAO reductase YedYZ molybdopterin-dependent catalytic subunit